MTHNTLSDAIFEQFEALHIARALLTDSFPQPPFPDWQLLYIACCAYQNKTKYFFTLSRIPAWQPWQLHLLSNNPIYLARVVPDLSERAACMSPDYPIITSQQSLLHAEAKTVRCYPSGMMEIHMVALLGELTLFQYIEKRLPESTCMQIDNDGRTLFHYAAVSKSLSLLQYLDRQYPEYINRCAHKGSSILHYATFSESVEIMEWLHEHHPKLPVISKQHGFTIWHMAAYPGSLTVLKWLQAYYPDLAIVLDHQGNTIWHCGAFSGSVTVLEWLEEYYPELATIPNRDGRTIWHCAAASGSVSVLEWLMVHYPKLIAEVTRYNRTMIDSFFERRHPLLQLKSLILNHPDRMAVCWKEGDYQAEKTVLLHTLFHEIFQENTPLSPQKIAFLRYFSPQLSAYAGTEAVNTRDMAGRLLRFATNESWRVTRDMQYTDCFGRVVCPYLPKLWIQANCSDALKGTVLCYEYLQETLRITITALHVYSGTSILVHQLETLLYHLSVLPEPRELSHDTLIVLLQIFDEYARQTVVHQTDACHRTVDKGSFVEYHYFICFTTSTSINRRDASTHRLCSLPGRIQNSLPSTAFCSRYSVYF